MKRLSTGVLAVAMALALGLDAVAAPSHGVPAGNIGNRTVAQATSTAPPDFGSPPSGEVPILFNYHHVYTKPDTLRKGRVLAALVRNGTILVPLRAMFEQMGATVKYDPATKKIDVSKPGADIQLEVGKPEVTINGETRPLDVPPMLYKGVVVVPVRVVSEAMGAYVKWVDSAREVSIRYVPPTPPPTPAPVESATPAPEATIPPTPTPAPSAAPSKEAFVAGDYLISPKVYNEFSPGNTGKSSYAIRGAIEFDAFNLPWMLEGVFNSYQYPHNCAGAGDPQCLVTTIGQTGQTSVPAFTARDQDASLRFGLKVADPHVYVGVGYLNRTGNYGYPNQKGFGFGAEKLPDFNQQLSLYGNVWYYPNLKGNYTAPGGTPYTLEYNLLQYQVGLDYLIGNGPIFLDLGLQGDRGNNKLNAPSNFTHNGAYVGLGIKF